MSPVWNAERLTRLRELVAEGLTSADTGERLGLTRNAVCGARKRYAISWEKQPQKRGADLGLNAIQRQRTDP